MSSSWSIYVQATVFDYSIEFYSLALNVPGVDDVFEIRGGRRGSIPVATPIKPANIPLFGVCAAVDNTVYYIGGNPVKQHSGCPRSLPSLFSFDTRSHSTKRSWKKRASMHNARLLPKTAVVDGKIYVMSGCSHDPQLATKWAEVFDPKSGKWSCIPPPSPLPEGYGLFAVALPGLKKILVGSYENKVLHFFDTENGRWGQVDQVIARRIPCSLKPVAVGTTLVWFGGCTLEGGCKIHAYDIIKKTFFVGTIWDLDKALPLECLVGTEGNHGYPPLLHLSGNLFCLICVQDLPFAMQRISLLHCVTFCLSDLVLGAGRGFLKAAVRSSQAYVIKTPLRIRDAVVLR
ncbi:hypothetical protein Vadar_002161 [Vaccinium darrowii]|uniref:Uncharacterized protein n=1 Tax=Vaccinium darrowii TaxID=229202 RepID=A0ACB7XER1_9ERIC|nr:hypothetical protein Vadar_002161 [Vaccinium darrowii]